MAKFKLAGVLLVSVLLSGCILTSENPLKDAFRDLVDQELLGVWYRQDDNSVDKDYIVFQDLGDGHIKITDAAGESGDTYRVHITKIGQDKYLNVRDLKGQDPTFGKDYTFAYYQIKDGKLFLALLDEDAFVPAIEAGELKGEIDRSHNVVKGVRLIDSGENIIDFIKKQTKEDLLSEPEIYLKMQKPKEAAE